MNIVLVGLMGSGKSGVGRLLAERLGRPLIDTDALVEEMAGMKIPAIFDAEGEVGFREREAMAIAHVALTDGQVIATGGGAVLRPANREALRATGLVIWLDAPPEALYHRAKVQGLEKRPLLAGPDPLGRLRSLAQERAAAYTAAAHLRIETDRLSLADVVEQILVRVAEVEGERQGG